MPKIPLAFINVGDRMRQRVDADPAAFDRLKESLFRYGLIQPLVLDNRNNLIAGGRRYAAATALGWIDVDVVYKDTPEGEVSLREMELEENTQRADMPWQDKVRSVAEIHRRRQGDAAQSGDLWTMQLTGELLGMALSQVGYMTQLDKLIRAGDTDIVACATITDAINLMTQRRLDDMNKRLADRIREQAKKNHPVRIDDPRIQPTVEGDPAPIDDLLDTSDPVTTVSLTNTVQRIDALDFLNSLARPVHHIISDPPYAIDMDMLEQENSGMDISRVVATHQVDANEALLYNFIIAAKDKFTGFMVLWCDQTMWQTLYDIGIKCDLAVQRWPLTWVKPNAMNQAAQYNTTKNTEIAIVMRQKGATIPRPVQTSVIMSPASFVKDHPFSKPPAVWSFLYQSFCRPGETVLDPFAGTGSAPLTALDHGLNPLCGEVEEHHYNALLVKMRDKYRNLLGEGTVFI